MGVVLQECGFPLHLKVAELLDLWRSFYQRPLVRDELLALVELADQAGQLVKRLSGGQRRRLDFALALAGDPELVFLDEPTTGFDPEARRRCWTAIDNLRGLGKTVLLTTHYLDEAEHLADRVAILRDGRICASGTLRPSWPAKPAPNHACSWSNPASKRSTSNSWAPPKGWVHEAVTDPDSTNRTAPAVVLAQPRVSLSTSPCRSPCWSPTARPSAIPSFPGITAPTF